MRLDAARIASSHRSVNALSSGRRDARPRIQWTRSGAVPAQAIRARETAWISD